MSNNTRRNFFSMLGIGSAAAIAAGMPEGIAKEIKSADITPLEGTAEQVYVVSIGGYLSKDGKRNLAEGLMKLVPKAKFIVLDGGTTISPLTGAYATHQDVADAIEAFGDGLLDRARYKGVVYDTTAAAPLRPFSLPHIEVIMPKPGNPSTSGTRLLIDGVEQNGVRNIQINISVDKPSTVTVEYVATVNASVTGTVVKGPSYGEDGDFIDTTNLSSTAREWLMKPRAKFEDFLKENG